VAPGDLSDQEVGACEDWLARCFPRVPDSWFRTLWVLVHLVKEDRREWHQMSPADFEARGTHLKESAQREALRELTRVNLIEKRQEVAKNGVDRPNWLRPNLAVDPESLSLRHKKGDVASERDASRQKRGALSKRDALRKL
jgi:hypothetical protein